MSTDLKVGDIVSSADEQGRRIRGSLPYRVMAVNATGTLADLAPAVFAQGRWVVRSRGRRRFGADPARLALVANGPTPARPLR